MHIHYNNYNYHSAYFMNLKRKIKDFLKIQQKKKLYNAII